MICNPGDILPNEMIICFHRCLSRPGSILFSSCYYRVNIELSQIAIIQAQIPFTSNTHEPVAFVGWDETIDRFSKNREEEEEEENEQH